MQGDSEDIPESSHPAEISYVPPWEDFKPAPRRRPQPLDFWPMTRLALLPGLLAGSLFWGVGWTDGAVSWLSLAKGHEYWRVFSALLAHADFSHALSNAPAILFLGWLLRGYFGFLLFPVLAVAAGAAANALTVALSVPHMRLLGASGMVYAMYGMWITLYVVQARDKPISRRIVHGVGVALLSLGPGWARENVSHLAHGTGFVLGVTFALAAAPFVTIIERNVPRYAAVVSREVLRK